MTAEACLEKTGGKVILFSSSPIANTVYREKLKTEKYTNKMQNNINNSNNNHNYNNNNYSNSSSNSNNYSNNDNLNSNFNCKERERLSAYGTEDEISLYGNLETVLAHSQKQTGTDKQGKQEDERKLERNFIEKNLLLAEKFEKNKICVDLFFLIEDRLLSDRKKLNQKNSKNTKIQDLNFRDICVLSECCDRTGGHTHFVSGSMKIEENEKRLSDELIQCVSDTYAQDCVMKVRTNNGIKVGNYFGVGVYDALLGEVECSGLDTETTMCFTLRYNKNITIKDDEKVSIQIAILYTDVLTRKMVRVLNLVLTASVSPSVVFRHADLDCVVATITKIAVDRALRYPLSLQANVPITGQVVLTNETPCRDYLVSTTAKILKCYRLHCSPQSPRGQLILPEPLKLLPLYTLGLLKHTAFSENFAQPKKSTLGPLTVSGLQKLCVRASERTYELRRLRSLSVRSTVCTLYPRFYSFRHVDEDSEEDNQNSNSNSNSRNRSSGSSNKSENGNNNGNQNNNGNNNSNNSNNNGNNNSNNNENVRNNNNNGNSSGSGNISHGMFLSKPPNNSPTNGGSDSPVPNFNFNNINNFKIIKCMNNKTKLS